ncbi:flagellar basal-body rod protein FlgG [Aestuariivirga litoralis]|uniref:flagellar basal-body rod protein FlgG n=1 Tax=Aestuariivirga litoralis TaxID=2650924 RepID=UPI0018C7B372|nr:flagellar basal-body rod protein FlgG [Aestuariivirga litoralis]MBG1233196.1 flagellar basal-body rod protein FlgG [Aestuariivirga litoralis]
MRVLSIAATGMAAQQTNVEVIANNIANANTTGFKRSRAEFTDLLYQMEKNNSVPSASGDNLIPEGAELGLGVKLSSIRSINIQGPIVNTNNQLDLAINGGGWFQVQGAGGQTLYTRAGTLNTDANGQIVNSDGLAVMPNITVPAETTSITINKTGEVFARIGNSETQQSLGQIQLANFINPAGLHALGGNMFAVTEASGPATVGNPGDPSYGVIEQGYLEQSNVDPVQEITDLISAQRVYELNSKVISAADDMSGVITKGLR